MTETQRELALHLLKSRGIMRLAELRRAGVHSQTLARMVAAGAVLRQPHGLYRLSGADFDPSQSFAEVAKLIPKGVVCLISALQFHELTLQLPAFVWVAVDRKQRLPRISFPPVRPVRFGEKAMSTEVERHVVDGVEVAVFGAAKSVVDCFRYRKQVGMDVALEGLRNAVRERKVHPDSITDMARRLRVWSVIRPYLDAVLADE